jgi:hypothetical protein
MALVTNNAADIYTSDTCKNNGQYFNSTCICNTNCGFRGNFCEISSNSRNLWQYGLSNNLKFSPMSEYIVSIIIGMLVFLSNILALQTYLCSKKIRITNLGVYLIVLALSGSTISFIRILFGIMNLAFNFKKSLIQCAIQRLLINSIVACLYWLNLFIAVERTLIQYNKFSLYDSRRRSLLACLLLYILMPLTIVLPIVFGRKYPYTVRSNDFCQLNFTSIGYTFFILFYYINYLASPLSVTIGCMFVFSNLIQHRRGLVDEKSFLSTLYLVASKHHDFYLPTFLFTLLTSPYFILDTIMTCLRASNVPSLAKITTIFNLLGACSTALTFPVYVYLSKVYWSEFLTVSYVGRFLKLSFNLFDGVKIRH